MRRIPPTPLWAMAKTGARMPAVLKALCEAAAGKSRTSMRQISPTPLWAMAKTGARMPAVFKALGEAAAEKVQDFYAPELANTSLGHDEDGRTHACGDPGSRQGSC